MKKNNKGNNKKKHEQGNENNQVTHSEEKPKQKKHKKEETERGGESTDEEGEEESVNKQTEEKRNKKEFKIKEDTGNKITYLKGDATLPQAHGHKIIARILSFFCNFCLFLSFFSLFLSLYFYLYESTPKKKGKERYWIQDHIPERDATLHKKSWAQNNREHPSFFLSFSPLFCSLFLSPSLLL
jgi:hypothetical protein